jgi:hypothetical protein
MQYRPKRVFLSTALDSLFWQTSAWLKIRSCEEDLIDGERIVIQGFVQAGDVDVQC